MIDLVNIKTGEKVSLKRPHQIGAYINSSNIGVNSNKGQDFGWRLAPNIVVRIDEMASDIDLMEKISARKGIPVDEITTIHLVQYLSELDDRDEKMKEAELARNPQHQESYEKEIEKLKSKKTEIPVVKSVPANKKK